MGTFAETAIIDYHLSFADQGKQTSVLNFSFQQLYRRLSFPFAANKWKLPFFVSSVFHLQNSGNMETSTWRHGGIET
jgi:predicted acetyltransferase